MSSTKDTVLKYALLILFVALVASSYYRFIVLQDYYVLYEVSCDPYSQDCYIGCEDDLCEEEYHYALIERHAPAIHDLCGSDITDCEEAEFCAEDETDCSVMLCDPLEEECDELTYEDEEYVDESEHPISDSKEHIDEVSEEEPEELPEEESMQEVTDQEII